MEASVVVGYFFPVRFLGRFFTFCSPFVLLSTLCLIGVNLLFTFVLLSTYISICVNFLLTFVSSFVLLQTVCSIFVNFLSTVCPLLFTCCSLFVNIFLIHGHGCGHGHGQGHGHGHGHGYGHGHGHKNTVRITVFGLAAPARPARDPSRLLRTWEYLRSTSTQHGLSVCSKCVTALPTYGPHKHHLHLINPLR